MLGEQLAVRHGHVAVWELFQCQPHQRLQELRQLKAVVGVLHAGKDDADVTLRDAPVHEIGDLTAEAVELGRVCKGAALKRGGRGHVRTGWKRAGPGLRGWWRVLCVRL